MKVEGEPYETEISVQFWRNQAFLSVEQLSLTSRHRILPLL